LHLGVVAPRLALGKKHAATATRQHAENDKDDGANEIATHSPRHGARMRWLLLTFLQRLARPLGGACAPHAMVKNCANVMDVVFTQAIRHRLAEHDRIAAQID
jgi:hypothetical protein